MGYGLVYWCDIYYTGEISEGVIIYAVTAGKCSGINFVNSYVFRTLKN